MARWIVSLTVSPSSKKTFVTIDRSPLNPRPKSSSSRNLLPTLRSSPRSMLPMQRQACRPFQHCNFQSPRQRPRRHRHCPWNSPIWACGPWAWLRLIPACRQTSRLSRVPDLQPSAFIRALALSLQKRHRAARGQTWLRTTANRASSPQLDAPLRLPDKIPRAAQRVHRVSTQATPRTNRCPPK